MSGKPLKRCVGPATREQTGDIRVTVSSAFIPMSALFLVVTSAVTGRSFSVRGSSPSHSEKPVHTGNDYTKCKQKLGWAREKLETKSVREIQSGEGWGLESSGIQSGAGVGLREIMKSK